MRPGKRRQRSGPSAWRGERKEVVRPRLTLDTTWNAIGYEEMGERSKSRMIPGFRLKQPGESSCCSLRWGRLGRHRIG